MDDNSLPCVHVNHALHTLSFLKGTDFHVLGAQGEENAVVGI